MCKEKGKEMKSHAPAKKVLPKKWAKEKSCKLKLAPAPYYFSNGLPKFDDSATDKLGRLSKGRREAPLRN